MVAPVGVGADGQTYNINADDAAGAIAGALHATRLLMLTDVQGVLDAEHNLIPELSIARARAAIADGTISGGMIPKVENCLEALGLGAKGAVILDGRIPHAVLLELFYRGGAWDFDPSIRGRKMFFSEERNQKTFAYWCSAVSTGVLQ